MSSKKYTEVEVRLGSFKLDFDRYEGAREEVPIWLQDRKTLFRARSFFGVPEKLSRKRREGLVVRFWRWFSAVCVVSLG